MNIEEVNRRIEAGENFDALPENEKTEIVKTILNDPIAYQRTITGAILLEDFNLAFALLQKNTSNHWFERGESNQPIPDN